MQKRELTNEEINKISQEIAKLYIDMEKKFVIKMLDEYATPFWIKWWRKLKKTIKK